MNGYPPLTPAGLSKYREVETKNYMILEAVEATIKIAFKLGLKRYI